MSTYFVDNGTISQYIIQTLLGLIISNFKNLNHTKCIHIMKFMLQILFLLDNLVNFRITVWWIQLFKNDISYRLQTDECLSLCARVCSTNVYTQNAGQPCLTQIKQSTHGFSQLKHRSARKHAIFLKQIPTYCYGNRYTIQTQDNVQVTKICV